jgi:hypothetical protein
MSPMVFSIPLFAILSLSFQRPGLLRLTRDERASKRMIPEVLTHENENVHVHVIV